MLFVNSYTNLCYDVSYVYAFIMQYVVMKKITFCILKIYVLKSIFCEPYKNEEKNWHLCIF